MRAALIGVRSSDLIFRGGRQNEENQELPLWRIRNFLRKGRFPAPADRLGRRRRKSSVKEPRRVAAAAAAPPLASAHVLVTVLEGCTVLLF